MRRGVTAILSLLTISTMGLPALAATLTPDEIKAQFGTGTSFNGVTVPGGRRYSLTLSPDGTAKMMMLNDKSVRTGKWRVAKADYCSKWGNNAEHCYTIQQGAEGFDVLNRSGTAIAHWMKKQAAGQ